MFTFVLFAKGFDCFQLAPITVHQGQESIFVWLFTTLSANKTSLPE